MDRFDTKILHMFEKGKPKYQLSEDTVSFVSSGTKKLSGYFVWDPGRVLLRAWRARVLEREEPIIENHNDVRSALARIVLTSSSDSVFAKRKFIATTGMSGVGPQSLR